MKPILRYYNRICAKKHQQLGFSRIKTTSARICGDVLQTFTFKCSPNGSTCSVNFGIIPLCMPEFVSLDAGRYELDAFIAEQHKRSSEWDFDPNSDKSMMNCIESISQSIDRYLLPLFDTCRDCRTSLPELIKLEELFDCNRKKTLHLRGDSDCAAPWQERSMFDSIKYFMALKSCDWSYAQRYLLYQIDFYERRLESFNNVASPAQPKIVKERFLAKLALYSEHLAWLNSGEYNCFNEILYYNENRMLAYIASQYPKILSHKTD